MQAEYLTEYHFCFQGDRLCFLSFKYEPNAGNVYLLKGKNTLDESTFKELCNEICTLLDGKGSLRGEQYQARINKPSQVTKAVSRIEAVIKSSVAESWIQLTEAGRHAKLSIHFAVRRNLRLS